MYGSVPCTVLAGDFQPTCVAVASVLTRERLHNANVADRTEVYRISIDRELGWRLCLPYSQRVSLFRRSVQ